MVALKWPRDRGARAGLALAVPLFAVAGAALGATLADALCVRGADGRLVAVTLGACVPLSVLRVARPGSRTRTRALFALLSLPTLASVLAPRSAWAVGWLASGVLFLLVDAAAHAARTALALSRSRARFALGALASAPCAYLASAAFVVLFNTQLVVLPARLAHSAPRIDPGERAAPLVTEDGLRLGATYTPGSPGAPAIVLAHGVADGRTRLVPWAERLAARGWHVLRFDFRAHGTSDGAVCTYGQREEADVRAAVRAARALPGVDPRRLAVVGASMGGGSVLAAAPSLPALGVRALVLLAPASRYPPLVERRVRWLGPLAPAVLRASAHLARAAGQTPMPEWVPARRLAGAPELPVLVLHGDRDSTIPLSLSRRLAREHRRATLVVVAGAAHDELSTVIAEDDTTWAGVEGFLARALAARP